MYVIFDKTNSLKIREEELNMDTENLKKKLKDMTIEDTPQEKEDVEQHVEEVVP